MALVEFTREDLEALVRGYVGEPEPAEIEELLRLARVANTRQGVDEALGFASTILDAEDTGQVYEFEGRVTFDPWDSRTILRYVMISAERSDATVLYDVERGAFSIGSLNHFIERWEARHPIPTAGGTVAHVQFPVSELARWLREASGVEQEDAEVAEAYEEMMAAETSREVNRVLQRLNDLADGHGVESVAPDLNPLNHRFDYVNMGDTYVATVGYDQSSSSFILTSWGDWMEGVEREMHEQGEPAHQDEDVCVTCGRVWGQEDLEYDGDDGAVCRECIEKRKPPPPPTWWPPDQYPLIAMLRSVEGEPIAVHYFPTEGAPLQPIILAFSVPAPDGTFYSTQRTGREFNSDGLHLPHTNTWENLVGLFARDKVADLYVCGVDWTPGQTTMYSIEREMFMRLNVAMSSFMDSGLTRQPVRAFLEVPPILWTCAQVNEVQWIDDERGDGGGVQAFVRRTREPGSRIESDDLVVWAATGDELRQLIDDGFIAWGRDDTVREYLRDIGVCRAR